MSIRPLPILPFRPPGPYIRPIPEPVKKRANMTIVVGFQCTNGVLLCADTLMSWSGSTGKTYQSKILPVQPEADSYLAYAGDRDFIDDFLAEVRKATAGKSGTDLLETVGRVYSKFHSDHYTHAPKSERTWAHILITAKVNGKVVLYAGRARHFSQVESCCTVGIGAEHAESIVQSLYEKKLPMDTAYYVGIHTLYKVKKFVQGCGGKTDVAWIGDREIDESFAFYRRTPKEVEEDLEFLDRKFEGWVMLFPRLVIPNQLFKIALKAFGKMLMEYRTPRIKKVEKQIKLYKELQKRSRRTP